LVGPDQRYHELTLMVTDNTLDRLRARLPR